MNRSLQTFFLEVKESLVMALVAIRTNKLRSSLTLLGITVGVFSIISVMTAMGVLVNSIESGMQDLGVNTFQVQKNPRFGGGGHARDRSKFRNRKNISYEQGLRVQQQTPLALLVGLESFSFGRVVVSDFGKTNPNSLLYGENVEGISTNNWIVGEGRAFNQDEVNSARPVVILGDEIVKKVFPKVEALGKSVRIDGQNYQVIGVFQPKGQAFGGGGNIVVIPITTFFSEYGKERSVNIMVQSTSKETYDDCIEQVRGTLRAIRGVPPGEDDDFDIWSNDSQIREFNNVTKYVRFGILIISAIALLAAGVGVMNIMLVSVTERTREIGIRKAIGARKSNILTQFILEAIVLSELGGLLGIILGVIGGNVAAIMMEVPLVIPWDWAAIGFGICSLIGIVFGVYPAWKASNLDPIESLRYE